MVKKLDLDAIKRADELSDAERDAETRAANVHDNPGSTTESGWKERVGYEATRGGHKETASTYRPPKTKTPLR